MKPNVVLITIDSLRADHMGCYGYLKDTTPFIDSYINRSTLYKKAYANGPNTPNSFSSIICSRYILESEGFTLPKRWKSIAQLLKKDGYNTYGYIAGNSWVSEFFGYDRGFDEFNSYLDHSYRYEDKLIGKKIKNIYKRKDRKRNKVLKLLDEFLLNNYVLRKKSLDEYFYNDVIEKIKNIEPPYFLWVHFMDVHYPYCPKREYQKELSKSMNSLKQQYLNLIVRLNRDTNKKRIDDIISLYDATILQVDKKVEHIINSIKKPENDLIIVTSDHGECFKEHGNFSHRTYDMYNELLHVPLIIKYPKQLKGKEINEQFSLINLNSIILDTVHNKDNIRLDIIDDNNEIIYSEGYNMPKIEKFIEEKKIRTPRVYSIIYDNKKLIIDNMNKKYLLFDLTNDKKEKKNKVKEDKKNLLLLSNLLDKHIEKEKESRIINQF